MKKLILIGGLLVNGLAYAQYPNGLQTLGNDSNVVKPKGGFQARVINLTYADTAAANLERIRQYPGAQIFTTSDNKFWLRNATADGWINQTAAIVAAGLTKVDDTNVTLTLGGTPLTALLQPVSITLGWTGTLSVPRGGIGVGTLASNGVLYGNGTGAVQALAVNSGALRVLSQTSSGAPVWTDPASFVSTTTPAGNFGNIQLNRNSAFATPASDSLDWESASGLSTKSRINVHDGTAGTPAYTFTSDPDNGFYLGAANSLSTSVGGTETIRMSTTNTWFKTSFIYLGSGADLILEREAAAIFQLGSDAASPVSQIAKGSDGLGSNIAGGAFTIAGGRGTGTGVGGSLIFQTSPAGSTGSSQNALATALTLASTGAARLNKYTTSAFTGTPVNLLATDASGNVIQTALSPSTPTWQQTLTAGSTLTTNNTVAMGATNFVMSGTDGDGFKEFKMEDGDIILYAREASLSAPEGSYLNVIGSGGVGMEDRGITANHFNKIYTSTNIVLSASDYTETSYSSNITLTKDSIHLLPRGGLLNIDSIRSWTSVADTAFKRLMTWDERNGRWEYYDGQFPRNQILSTTDVFGDALIDLSLTGTSIKFVAGTGISLGIGGTTDDGVITINSTFTANTFTDANGFDFTDAAGAISVTTTAANTRLLYSNSGGVGGVSGVTSNGTSVTATSQNLIATKPIIITSIDDVNGNELIYISATTNAVNGIRVRNSAAGSEPEISAEGDDTDVSLTFGVKGNALYQFLGTSSRSATLVMHEDSDNGGDYVAFQSPTSLTVSTIYVLPAAPPPASDYFLTSDINGNLAWQTSGGGGWGTTGTVATLTGASTLAMAGNTFDFSGGNVSMFGGSYNSLFTIDISTGNWSIGDSPGDVGTPYMQGFGSSNLFEFYASAGYTILGGAVKITNLAGTGSRTVLADANGTLSAPVSDRSTKENIKPLYSAIGKIMQLNPVSFDYRKEFESFGKGTQVGFIAQDIQKILPNSVYTNFSNGKMGYNEIDLVPILVKAMQEQQKQIDELKSLIQQLIKAKK